MLPITFFRLIFCIVGSVVSTLCSAAGEPSYSAWAGKNYPREVLWGDTHLHTSYSLDANLFGLSDLTPEDAYKFARGETITASNGMQARLNKPLDFLVVAEHSEYLGVMRMVRAGKIRENETARRWQAALETQGEFGHLMLEIAESYKGKKPLVEVPYSAPSPWSEIGQMADAANDPGHFTAMIGFEWSSTPQGNNLHRVVIFRDGSDKTNQVAPFSSFDSEAPEALWDYLAAYAENTGGDALAIPHNGNLSGGLMFGQTDYLGKPITQEYARKRHRWEPLIEVTQIKGDGEAHPQLSPDDEFADYETWDVSNIAMSTPQEAWMFQYEYARPALKLGLQLAAKTGTNPYAFGLIGSSDSHTALSAIEEDNFWGKLVSDEPSAQRSTTHWGVPTSGIQNWSQVAAGYIAVWATQNTREAIFDALRRREVYASTGPRIRVRFFGGWNYTEEDLWGIHPALVGYEKGVPMGADLPAPGSGSTTPKFMAWAMSDSDGANLDRIQIIKGWMDGEGKTQEKVYDVAWSGGRVPDSQGKLEAVGNTVDVKNASYRNTIGAPQLRAVWTDPDFDADERAFYYLRVLEIPSPRWTAYDQVKLDTKVPEAAPLRHQERAYSSAIWYSPE